MGSVIVVKGMWQSWWVRVSVIAGFGLLVRLAFVLGITRFDEPVGDQLYYSAQALTNARGEWFEQPFAQGMPAADHPPLTSFLLTPVTWLTEASGSFITAQRLTMTLIGVVSIVIMAMIGRLLAGDRVGTIAAIITAVYANVWVNDGLIMAETPTFFLVAVSILLALTYRRRHDIASLLGLGVTAGLLALTRPELAVVTVLGAALVFSVASADLSLATRSKRAAIVLATSLVIVSPWILWNQSRFSDSVFISTNDGLTLAGANCDSTFYGDVGGWDIWCAYETPVPIDADASLASKLMRRDGVAYLRDHIGRYPTVAAARVARVLSVGFIGSNNNAAKSEGRPTGVSMLGVIQFWLIVVAAGFGLRQLSNRTDRIILAVLLPFVILVAMVANAYVRFRLPAEVGLIVLAAVGIQQMLNAKQKPATSFASE
jgi:4-amino-4-deoxy-L-arabinose transferase-like glycosyltransferase